MRHFPGLGILSKMPHAAFRHRFATNTLVQWYRSGQDPERRLPLLSTYLGHVHVSDTQWYLQGSPELMREAMQRLQERWEDRP